MELQGNSFLTIAVHDFLYIGVVGAVIETHIAFYKAMYAWQCNTEDVLIMRACWCGAKETNNYDTDTWTNSFSSANLALRCLVMSLEAQTRDKVIRECI